MQPKFPTAFLLFFAALITTAAGAQGVMLLGLRSENHVGAFHGLKQDAAGNLYTLLDSHDGVRLLKFSADGTELLAQTRIGQGGDSGIALDVDSAGFISVAGTSTSQGAVTGTAGTAFPNRSDSTTNSFVARFNPSLSLQWLTFTGSGRTAVSAIAVNDTTIYVTGGIFAPTLPVTSDGVQQAPAPNSNGNGFVEAFHAATGTLQYATYLTGANGDTQPAAIAADSSGNAYIAGTTTATGYPTAAALLPVIRYSGSSPVSGFVTRLNAAGDGFVFSTFVPGNGLASLVLDGSGSGSVLLSGDIASGLFPLMNAQQPMASGLSYQSVVRLSLDGSQVLSSTLLVPASTSVVAAGSSGQAWVFASSQTVAPLLPLLPLENIGNAFALRIGPDGKVDRDARLGGNAVNNSGFAGIPVTAGGVVVQNDGIVAVAGSVAPTLSSDLLPNEHYDLPLAQAPGTAFPSAVRDALPSASCRGSACSGSAGMLARLAPDAATPQLALSSDDHPNLTLRNLGIATANGVQITANGYTIQSDCDGTLAPGDECSLALNGNAAGSVTVQAANFPALTTQLPATARSANPVVVRPHELSFGVVTAGSSSATRTLTLQNLGNSTQLVSSKLPANAAASAYMLSESGSTCSTTGDGLQKTLPANSACTITLSFTPSASSSDDGAVNATWQIGSYDIPVTAYAQAAATSLSATVIDFGRQFVDGLRAPRYLYLSNASDAAQPHETVVSTNPVFSLTDECPLTLQPHSICRIALGYLSTAAPSSDALSLVVDASTVTLLGETLPQPSIVGSAANPNLSLSESAVVFSDPVTVTTASANVQTVLLTNSGASAFALQIGITGDFTDTTDCPAALPGGASCKVNLVFTPSAPGMRQGLLSITAGATGPAYVTLSGTGAAILPQNNGIVFGDIPLNTPTVQWLKMQASFVSAIATSSDKSYRVVLVEDIGYGHGDPPVADFAATAIGSCLNCWLGIQFFPSAVGTDVSAISFRSAAAGQPTSVVVSGNGVPASGLILTPLTEDFGPVAVHTGSASTVFQLINATGDSVTVSNPSVTGDFSITMESTGGAACHAASLEPGESCFLPIRFLPSATGTRTGQLTVTTSAGSSSATLIGTGSEDPGIGFTPGELRFDNLPGSASTQQAITLTNTASVPESIGVPQSSDPHFTPSSACFTIAPGSACTITVTYAATDALSNGILTIPVTAAPAGAASTATYAIALTGLYTAETAGLQIIPGEHTTVDFGAATTEAPSGSRLLHVNNLSGKNLNISIETPRQFAITSSNCGDLPSGGSCDLAVQFTPLTGGDTTGTVFVQGASVDGSAPVNGLGYLEGYGQGSGTLSITGNLSILGMLDFGQIPSGQSASQTLTLTNPARSAPGTVITVRRVRSEAPFLTTTNCGQPLAPGQSCTVTITYAPIYQVTAGTGQASARIDNASLTVESDAADAPQSINLSGQAAPVMASAAVNGEPLRTFTTSQGSLTFADTPVGSASAAQSFQLANTGTTDVHIQKLIPSAGFAATTDCATLTAGATCTVSVTFQPQAAVTTLGSLAIQTDAVASLEFLSLLGTGGAASVALSPQAIDFGGVLVGRSASQFAILTNTGGVPVTIQGIGIAAAGFTLAGASTAGNPCPSVGGTLPAGASCNIGVLFTPSVAGTLRGTLTVATSATPLPLSIALSGVGAVPQLSVSSPALSFGNVLLGSQGTLSLTLRNISTLPVDGLVFTATGSSFSMSNTCGITTLAAGSSCSVNVTFAPTATGAVNGTLLIASNDPASPIPVALSGTGIPGGSFLLTVNGGSSASMTVEQGIAATYSLGITPTNGYSGVVALTCAPDSTVAYAACSLLPPTVTLTGGTQTSTATITTVTGIAASRLSTPENSRGILVCLLPAGGILLFLWRRKAAFACLILLAASSLGGCGGGPDPNVRYIAPGTYTFHVTASSTNGVPVSQTVTLTLTVAART